MTGPVRLGRWLRSSPAIVLVVTGACASGGPEEPAPAAGEDAVAVVLTLSDRAPGPIWLQESDAESQPRWVVLRGSEGATVFLRERCAIPECEGDGGVCGMALPVVRRLEPGDSIRLMWDGRSSSVPEGRRCEVREPVAAGSYVAEFCWTTSAPDSDYDPIEGPALTGITCRSRSLEMPTDRISVVVG